MRSSRAAERFLVLAFLCVIAIPPLVQTVVGMAVGIGTCSAGVVLRTPNFRHLRRTNRNSKMLVGLERVCGPGCSMLSSLGLGMAERRR